MDQLKKLLAGAQKNAFWIVSALTIVLGIVGYWLSRSTMDKIFQEQSQKIDTQYSALSTISNEVPTHPNAKTHTEMDKKIAALSEDVQAAWIKQYERQAEILKWPADKIPARFIAKVEKLRPIELALEFPPVEGTDPLVVGDKMQYAKYINEQFPELAAIIGTTWVGTPPVAAAGMMGGGMMSGGSGSGMSSEYSGGDPSMMSSMSSSGGMMGGPMGLPGAAMFNRKPDLVTWPKAGQDAVIADVQTWRTKYPSTHDVLYTQENIWILKGLLEIIAQVNQKANAVANFQATVKEIEFLRIGRSAVGKVGTIDRPTVGGMQGMGMDAGMESGSMMGSSDMGGSDIDMATSSMGSSDMGSSGMGGSNMESGADGMMGMVAATPDPANGRYVDAAYAPLTGDDLRAKMKSSSPEDAYFAVAKRVPVRLRLKVDQRRIQTLIAECGNANLLFEIRQIRIGDTIPAPASGAGSGYGMSAYGGGSGYEGMSGGGDAYMGDPSMMSGDTMGSMSMSGMGTMAPSKVWDIAVEIYGVVYLFNPPDAEKLGLNKVTAETEVEDKVELSADVVQANETAAQPAAGAAQEPPADGQAPAQQVPAAQLPQPGQVPGAAPGAGQGGTVAPGSAAPGSATPPAAAASPAAPAAAAPAGGLPNAAGAAAAGGALPVNNP